MCRLSHCLFHNICSIKQMVSWSTAAAAKRQENRQNTPRFCSRYFIHPFADRGEYFGRKENARPYARPVWLTLPRNGTFVSDDGSHAHHRSNSTEAVSRLTTKKCGSPFRRSPCLGLSFAGTGFRSFLVPVAEDFLHRFLNHSSQHCFDKGHGFLL